MRSLEPWVPACAGTTGVRRKLSLISVILSRSKTASKRTHCRAVRRGGPKTVEATARCGRLLHRVIPFGTGDGLTPGHIRVILDV